MFGQDREPLPGLYEGKYKSEKMKEQIADDGMWGFIPCVDYAMNSPKGRRRLKQNDLLFSFVDEFFPEFPFAFEPNMIDGRYVLLPEYVNHQGVGLCVSNDLPGFLEMCHFWYPADYTEKTIPFGPAQVYIPILSMKSSKELADIISRVFIEDNTKQEPHCTFTFGNPEKIVYLRGYFLDNLDITKKTIKEALKDAKPQEKRNAEGLIGFMERIMNE